MKILLINSHHKMIGGAERYYFDLGNLLKSKGHSVAYFSMKDRGNIKSKWSKYFVKNINFQKTGIRNTLYKFFRMFYSLEAKTKIAKLLNDFKPNIVHMHNIYYYLSPSILGEIKKRNIPIVQTIHDYQLISPNVSLFYKGKVCEITKKHLYYKAFLDRTVNGTYIASIAAVIASYVQHFFGFYKKYVDAFITPSKFVQNKFEEYRFQAKNIIHIDNFVNNPKVASEKQKGKYVLFFGRINEAKGIFILLNAARKLPEIKFKIAGNFVDKKIKSEIYKKMKSEKIKNVEFVGFRKNFELHKLVSQCSFVVIPSIWYENQPYSILESFALGKTVVASNIGGIPEIVEDGINGLLFESGNINELSSKIKKLWNNSILAKKLGDNARKTVDERFGPETHYRKIITIYEKVLFKQ